MKLKKKLNTKLFLEFDAEVQRERVKAQDALKDIENIKELIEIANTQAAEVERVLNGSEDNAKNAREIAQNAQVKQKLLRNLFLLFTNVFVNVPEKLLARVLYFIIILFFVLRLFVVQIYIPICIVSDICGQSECEREWYQNGSE